jgi:hypothetical protein
MHHFSFRPSASLISILSVCIAGAILQGAFLMAHPVTLLPPPGGSAGPWDIKGVSARVGNESTQVVSLYPVTDAKTRSTAELWAQVKNTGETTAPENATVWFLVTPADSNSGDWVCSASIYGLAAGDTQWYKGVWSIPRYLPPGSYNYWARVYIDSDPISEWAGPQNFAIELGTVSAQIVSLWPVANAATGGAARLWAQVKNTGNVSIPSDGTVWFWVSGVSDPWVGYAVIGGLAPGATGWYLFDWNISVELRPGTYTYKAQAWDTSGPISDMSAEQDFRIAGESAVLAHIVGLRPVNGALVGGRSTLWVEIKNIGSTEFPLATLAYFYVSGLDNPWVGYVSLGGLVPEGTAWYSLNWDIPRSVQPGNYTYWVRVYRYGVPISDWSSGQGFTVSTPKDIAAQILNLSPVSEASTGTKITLSAQVRNIGSVPLPSGAVVAFYVNGLSTPLVGSASAANLTVDGTAIFTLAWDIPASIKPGDYAYWAQVLLADATPVSERSAEQPFAIGIGAASGFNETFDGGTADRWIQDNGSWFVRNGWLTAQGMENSAVTCTFDYAYSNFDYSVKLFRSGLETGLPVFLEVRASGPAKGLNNAILNGYRFQFSPDGRFSVYKNINGLNSSIREATFSGAIIQGQNWNILRVVAVDTQFWFYINDHLVWSGLDPSFTKGRVGVGLFSSGGGAAEGVFVDWAKLAVNPTPPAY